MTFIPNVKGGQDQECKKWKVPKIFYYTIVRNMIDFIGHFGGTGVSQ